jgi:hypothetical protein
MLLVRFALLIAIAGCSCVSADGEPIAGPGPSDQESADVTEAFASPPNEDDELCDSLPDKGPCALTCDIDALVAQYVPVGTCAAFACTLDDGREVHVHACHPAS